MEYDANPPFALFELAKIQFTGVLSESGDQIELRALVTIFNPDRTQKGDSSPIQLMADAFRWRYCQTPLTPCPFPLFRQRLGNGSLEPTPANQMTIIESLRSFAIYWLPLFSFFA
jgi:hypothetical protein